MSTITKRVFLNTMVCPTLGWITNSEPRKQIESISGKLMMEEGCEINKRTQNSFEGGYLVRGDNISAAESTKDLINDKNVSFIFEATFLNDDFVAKSDILKRKECGWHIIEVKSSVNDKKEFIDDLAYTTMVAIKAGLEISGCSLMLLSRDYRLGMSDDKLCTEYDHTDNVLQRAKEFTDYCETVMRTISQDSKPDAELKWECKNCEIFKECLGQGIENHIFDLPRLSQKKFSGLIDLKVLNIEKMSEDFQLTPNQVKVKNAVKSGQAVINQTGLKDALESIVFPAYYLDFETVRTAIPLYQNTAPYTQIPTQYSLHICSGPGQVIKHFEYLGEPKNDPRKDLAERLISDSGKKGSILVYHRFEKDRINELIKLFEELAKDLKALIDRLVDLNTIISNNYYHPEFHGSFSIKDVLPVLVPDLSYEDMDVSNGLDAAAIFAYLAKGKYDDEEAKDKRKQLLEYCKLDTLAMVKLHEHLMEYT